MLKISSKAVNVAMSYKRLKMIKMADFCNFIYYSTAYNCDNSTFLFIFRCLLLVSASTDFNKIFGMCVKNINLQHVFFKFSLQVPIKKL